MAINLWVSPQDVEQQVRDRFHAPATFANRWYFFGLMGARSGTVSSFSYQATIFKPSIFRFFMAESFVTKVRPRLSA